MTLDPPSHDDLRHTLTERRQRVLEMGGESQVARQHERGKLTARERIQMLFDEGSFTEMGMLAHQHSLHAATDEPERTPADGVICGEGLIDGRPVLCAAYDFTVMAGSMGMVGEAKVARLRDRALRHRRPLVWLLDSAGARIQEAAGSTFAGSGALFHEQALLSGVVPMVAAVMGPCAAGTAYIPGLADFVPMVRDTASMSLGGARLVHAATGEVTTDHDMGGSQIHCRISGCADVETADDAACIDTVRRYLSHMPQHNRTRAPRRATDDPADRRIEEIDSLVPTNPRAVYDMRRVIRRLVDDGEVLEIKPAFARNILTVLARMDGESVGIVASQPLIKGGALDIDAADKAARFISLCDAFSLPLVYLQDVPGFIVGTEVERQGIIRHGAKMLFATSEATVPKVTVVLRKAYGAGYYVMCGSAYGADTVLAWPSAEISVMGPEGAVDIIFSKQIAAAEDPAARRGQLADEIRRTIDPYVAASWAMVDDIIDPRDTRSAICAALRHARDKAVEHPWRKHGVAPV